MGLNVYSTLVRGSEQARAQLSKGEGTFQLYFTISSVFIHNLYAEHTIHYT